jgi:hypothetical protein
MSTSTPCGLRTAKNHASGRGFRDQSDLLVGYGALYGPDRAAPLYDGSALRCACQTGRKKLIFSSTVVKDSSVARVLANAIPIAASAISQRIPPCSVPMGFACCGPAANTTVARPSATFFASNPIRRDCYVVRLCSFPKTGLKRNVLSTHELSAPDVTASLQRKASEWP